MKATAITRLITPEKMTWILLCQMAVIIPHVPHMQVWVSIFCVLIAIWGYFTVLGRWPYPGLMIRLLMVISACAGVGYFYGTLVGQDAGVALLIIMLSLKLLELKTQRDVMLFIFLGYFLVVTNFLFSQSIFMALYMLLACIGLTSTLVMLSRHDKQLQIKNNIRVASTLIFQAIPLMLVLFVLFPRLPGPLWMMPSDKSQAKTGLSNSMSPGSISNLIRSDAVAFRVKFDQQRPASSKLYWRGPVLTHFDGTTWNIKASLLEKKAEDIDYRGDETNYTITMQPHDKRWLFALDMPADIPQNSYINDEYSLVARKDVKEVLQYKLGSYTQYQAGKDPHLRQARHYLRLPDNLNPKTLAWADSIRQQYSHHRDRVETILQHFHDQAFVYTLSPPTLGKNSIDDFLFNTRKGFCEHYAGSFVYLMRALDIPARVVLGYQGGEYNELGDYMIVRQSDAHAWTEIWLQDEGWVRIDPTSAVAAERVESGIDAALPDRVSSGGLIRSVNPVFRNMILYWDSLNYNWQRWVLGYDASKQRGLLERLGIDSGNWKDVAIGIIVTIGTLILVITLWMNLRNKQVRKDSISRLYQLFCQRLGRVGFNRKPYEGPKDFATRILQQRQDLKDDIELITLFYMQLRYGRNPPAQLFTQYKNRIRQFRPKQISHKT